jgi:mannose-6-phosphate isomerase-like protein (cupin superfamily)
MHEYLKGDATVGNLPPDGHAPILRISKVYGSEEALGGQYFLPSVEVLRGAPATLEAWWDELSPGASSGLDEHDACELWYIASGGGILTIDEEQLELSTGMCVFIPSRAVHRVTCTGDRSLVTFSITW